MTDYRVRPYRSGDEGFCVFSWLHSHARSEHGKRWNTSQFRILGQDDHYWTEHRRIVLRLLRESDTRVVCDAEQDDIIWAWACTDGDDVLHFAVVNHKLGGDLAPELIDALVPGRLQRKQLVTHEQTGLRAAGIKVPSEWRYDPFWIAAKWAMEAA